MMSEKLLVRARRINWWLPGVGLILAHRLWLGLTIGLLFTLLANMLIWGVLIVPEDMPPFFLMISAGLFLLTYCGAQYLLARDIRLRHLAERKADRHRLLEEITLHLAAGDTDRALLCAEQLTSLADDDLLAALRVAQTLTVARDAPRGIEAWMRVRRLDIQAVYRSDADEGERRLRTGLFAQNAPEPNPNNSP